MWRPHVISLSHSKLYTVTQHNTEAAEVMREHPAKFEENVRRSLRGATIGGEKFPRLLK